MLISALITITLEVTARIIGYYNVTGFTYVIAVYFFILMFIISNYREKKYLDKMEKIKIEKK